MWVARFRLKDDKDIYSPVCVTHGVTFFAVPYTQYVKRGVIHLLVGGVLAGSPVSKDRFVRDVRNDPRVRTIERYHDYILVHAEHPLTREAQAEIRIFYNPQYLRVQPVRVSSDGWECWEVACVDREALNRLLKAARRYYHGKLLSLRQERLKRVSNLAMGVEMTDKQLEALRIAEREGYYEYPRHLTIPQLAKLTGRSYATFQEHLRRAENKLMRFFLEYR
ncbi:helix-turn-helix domain-containing protein [Candidatus Woesearchaeota archaeon]|nr:helix-turn-helix domain-containing protein [Candidatus Woesearchaeota archaeon]